MAFLIRWGLIVLGLMAIYAGISEGLNGPRVSEQAEPVWVDEAGAIRETRFVSIDTPVLMDRAVYRTALTDPQITTMPMDRVYALPARGSTGARDPYIGARVSYQGELLPMRVIVEELLIEEGNPNAPATLTGIRCIATPAAEPGALFIVSPRFRGEDDPAYEAWLKAGVYWGDLCAYGQATYNIHMEREFREVLGMFRESGLAPVAGGHVLFSMSGDPTPVRREGFAPLGGTDQTILVSFPNDQPPVEGQPVIGVAERTFNRMLGPVEQFYGSMPTHITVVDTDLTGTDINEATTQAAIAGVVFGLIMTGLGSLWVWSIRASKRRLRKRREEIFVAEWNEDAPREPIKDANRWAA